MPASIAYHTGGREGPVRVAGDQLSPCAVTKLPTRPTVGGRPATTGRTERPTWAARLVGGVVTPTNHRWAHLVSASSVTMPPPVMCIHGGSQHLVACAHSREQAEQVKARLAEWLAPRGLVFNEDKTKIVHLTEGFDFSGVQCPPLPKRQAADHAESSGRQAAA